MKGAAELEFVLRRVLVRSRRRKPRPPMWWLCVAFLVDFAALATVAAAHGYWLTVAGAACNGVIWWRALHSPPHYFVDRRTFAFWWPLGMALMIAGVFVR